MFGGAALTPALPPFPDLRHDPCGHRGCSPPTSMGSWCPSRVCSEPFPAGLPQWKWSCSARYRPGRPPPLMAMCSEAGSPSRLSITARDGIGTGLAPRGHRRAAAPAGG